MNVKANISKLMITILLSCVTPLAIAKHDDTIHIALTSQNPPYTIDHKKKTGIDPELISRVLERAGYQVSVMPTPHKRQDTITVRDDIDAVTGWVKDFLPGCHAARPYRYWFNVLIVPDSSDIKGLSDIAGKRLSAFEGARKYIENFDEFTKDVVFLVDAESSAQAGRMIKVNRVDAYIGDYVGYYFSLKSLYGDEEADRLTRVEHYFKVNNQRICFKDKAVRDAFDKTLDSMIDEGIYVEIYGKYAPGILPEHFPTKSR